MTLDRVSFDPEQMGGPPCNRDLRVTVSSVLGQLVSWRAIDDLLVDYPHLERADVVAAPEYATAIVNEPEMPFARPA